MKKILSNTEIKRVFKALQDFVNNPPEGEELDRDELNEIKFALDCNKHSYSFNGWTEFTFPETINEEFFNDMKKFHPKYGDEVLAMVILHTKEKRTVTLKEAAELGMSL
jgi:hypothetical protein